MKFNSLDFETVKKYLVHVDDEDRIEIEMYINAAKSYIKTYSGLSVEELDANEYFVMPTLMLISTFYENKTVEMSGKLSSVYKNLLNLGKVHSL